MAWEIVPGESLGPIAFGSRVEELAERLALHEDECDFDGTDQWHWYSSNSRDLLLHACNGAVVSVICERDCSFRGKNLLGMSEAEIRMLFADQVVVEGRVVELGQVLEIPGLGLQLGFSAGAVESVTMGVDPDAVLEGRRPTSQ